MNRLAIVIVKCSRQNKSSSREACGSEDIWIIAGFLEDKTTTVVGDAKEAPRFLRLSVVGFAPRAVRQKIRSERSCAQLHIESIDILPSGATLT